METPIKNDVIKKHLKGFRSEVPNGVGINPLGIDGNFEGFDRSLGDGWGLIFRMIHI